MFHIKMTRAHLGLYIAVGLILGLILVGNRQVFAQTFTVDSVSDGVDASPGDGSCATSGGQCTLRAAIQEANASAGADTITLPGGTYQLTVTGISEDAGLSGDLDITEDLVINGAGSATTIIDGNNSDRVFDVVNTATTFTLNDVTVQNGETFAAEDGGGLYSTGNLILNNCLVSDNEADRSGGGIAIGAGGSLDMTDSVVRDNSAFVGGGIDNDGGSVTITKSDVVDNDATGTNFGNGLGAGLYNSGSATVSETNFDGNIAAVDGGGVYNDGTISMNSSTLSNNEARFGGGLINFVGDATLTNVTISDNTATDTGGGIYNLDDVVLVNVTLSHNNATNSAGGLYNFSIAEVRNTIISDNGPDNCDAIAPLSSNDFNIDSGVTCALTGANDQSNADPLLGGLQNNGGETFTRALQQGSPAVDNGTAVGAPPVDQRGIARPQGGAFDIGAYELLETDLEIEKSGPTTVYAADLISWDVTVTNIGSSPSFNLIVTDTLPAGTTFSSASGSGWSCGESTGVVTCTLPSLASSGSAMVTVEADAPDEGGVITNQVALDSVTPDPDANNNTFEFDTTVIAHANLEADKEASVTGLPAGETLTYTLSVNNIGPSTALNIVMTDTLPLDGFSYVGIDVGAGWSCDPLAGTELVCTLVSLSGGLSSNPIIVEVESVENGTWINTLEVTSDVLDRTPANNETDVAVTVGAVADVSLDKTATPDPVDAGEALTYTLTIENDGPSTAFGLQIQDTLPNGVSYVGFSGAGWACDESSGDVVCTRNSMAANASSVVELYVTAPDEGGAISNAAVIGTSSADPNTSNNTTSVTTEVTAIADLKISKDGSPASPLAGTPVTYTILVENNGPSTATGLSMVDILPSDFELQDVAGTNWVCGELNGTVNCSLTSLAVGSAAPITLVAVPAEGGTFTNNSSISSGTLDREPADNSTTEQTVVRPVADLSVSKIETPDPVYAGEALTYTLSVANAGPSTAYNVTVVDTLPSGVSNISVSAPNWLCSVNANIVSCEYL